jgi:hypothetical protein
MDATQIGAAMAGGLAGAALMLLVARLRPRWLGLIRCSSATERLEAIRSSLLADLREVADQIGKPPVPIRMDRGEEPNSSEQRQAA